VELSADPEGTSGAAHLIAFNSCPEPKSKTTLSPRHRIC
jgi:hypothetical protein